MIYLIYTGHPINETVMQAVEMGCRARGIAYRAVNPDAVIRDTPDIAISYGILRGNAEAFTHLQENGKTWFEIDRGYINPGHFDGYYRISRNNLRQKYVPLLGEKKKKDDWGGWSTYGDAILVCPPSEASEEFYSACFKKPVNNQGCEYNPLGWCKTMVKCYDPGRHGFPVIWRNKSDAGSKLEMNFRRAIVYNSNIAIDLLIKHNVHVEANPVGLPDVYGWYATDFPNKEALISFWKKYQLNLQEFSEGRFADLFPEEFGRYGKSIYRLG